jgi:hypothetical protein
VGRKGVRAPEGSHYQASHHSESWKVMPGA